MNYGAVAQRCKKNYEMPKVSKPKVTKRDEPTNEYWARVQEVIDHLNMNINQFATALGLNRSETLYQIKRGNSTITRNIATRIVEKFPHFSLPWLMTGYGLMVASPDDNSEYIPYFSCDISDLPVPNPYAADSHIFIPQVGEADIALKYHNDDMAPSIPNGTILALKKTSLETLIYGDEHVILASNLALLRKIRRTDDPNVVRLEATCREFFDDIFLQTSSIKEVYAVKGKIILKR